MGPTVAEVTRTLLSGRLRGTVTVAGRASKVSHATDCAGLPMLLVPTGGPLDEELGGASPRSAPAPAVRIRVDDVPPATPAPHLGTATIDGRPRPLAGAAAATAVLEFAEANPVPDLFDVGGAMTLYLIEPRHVQLARAGVVVGVDVGDFMAADPDPLHEYEHDLLVDLADHHRAEMEDYFRGLLAAARVDCRTPPRAVRLDRYGFTLDIGLPEHARPRWVRISFARPVADRHELAHRLHPVLFHSSR
jgi:hypothetical protein